MDVLRYSPGDIVVLEVPPEVTPGDLLRQLDHVREVFAKAGHADVPVLVLRDGARFVHVRPKERPRFIEAFPEGASLDDLTGGFPVQRA